MIDDSRATVAAAEALALLSQRRRQRRDRATDVDELAHLLGLEAATFDAALHPGVWGYLEPGEDLVFLRAGLPQNARRFTLAHEIGHALLHRGRGALLADYRAGRYAGESANPELEVCRSADVETFDLYTDETLNPGQSYRPHAAVEQEANAFAVALLMPIEPFRETYLSLFARPNPHGAVRHVTGALAKRFGVSEDAALRRLQSLLAPDADRDNEGTVSVAPVLRGDEDQLAAARLKAPALVVAGPGAGKTATLVGRIAFLVEEEGARPEEILAVTFSRKAAAELRERAKTALHLDVTGALPKINTIHAFCLELLGEYGYTVGLPPDFRLAPDIECYFLVRQIMRDATLRRLSPLHAPDHYVRDAHQAISRAKDDLLTPDDVAREADRLEGEDTGESAFAAADALADLALIYNRYQEALATQGLVDYGDVIATCVRLLDERPDIAHEVASRWPHLLVDEYQDINRAMGALIARLAAAGCGLWAVGDADQAIYRFRGADPGIVSRFAESYPGASLASLVRNYRSQQPILAVASAFAAAFSQANDRLALEAMRGPDDVPHMQAHVVRLAVANSDHDEIAGLSRAIESRHAAGRAFRDQVALLRTRRQVDSVVGGLRERGIPVQVVTGAFERAEVRLLLAVVSLLSDPTGAGMLRAGLSPEHTFQREDAVALLREAGVRRWSVVRALHEVDVIPGISREGRAGLRRLARILRLLRQAPTVSIGLLQYVYSFTGMGAELLTDAEGGQDYILAVRRFLEIARAFDAQRAGSAANNNAKTADWYGFADYVAAVRLLRLDGAEARAVDGDDAVRVMTVHASKGLEFPVVYLPQLANRRFPLTGRASAVGRTNPSFGADVEGEGGLPEEASLFYVAMTRARDELVISRARRYGRQSYTPSPFFEAIERALADNMSVDDWSLETAAADGLLEESGAAEGNDSLLAADVFDVAELEAYIRCPRQYAYRHVDGFWTPTPLGSLYGRAVTLASRALEQDYARRIGRGEEPPSEDEARRLGSWHWRHTVEEELRARADPAAGASLSSLASYYERQSAATLAEYRETLARRENWSTATDSEEPDRRAHLVTVRLGPLTLRGLYDGRSVAARHSSRQVYEPGSRATDATGHARAKTRRSSPSPTIRDLFTELAAEQEGQERALNRAQATDRRRSSGNGSETTASMSSRQRERLANEAIEAAKGIRRGDFRAAPDEWKCQRCPFASACPV
ncbi:MAG TPA: UvrD-helicase domain-containing protein [Ktedonobacterales bacterium]